MKRIILIILLLSACSSEPEIVDEAPVIEAPSVNGIQEPIPQVQEVDVEKDIQEFAVINQEMKSIEDEWFTMTDRVVDGEDIPVGQFEERYSEYETKLTRQKELTVRIQENLFANKEKFLKQGTDIVGLTATYEKMIRDSVKMLALFRQDLDDLR